MIEEDETRSVTARDTKTLLQGDISTAQHLNYLNTTNNLFDMGTSSLLVEQGVRPGGLFAPGDRFIPCRPEES